MRSKPASQTEEYLTLAIKVITKKGSEPEKARLRQLLKDEPELEADYQRLKKELLEDAQIDMAELFLKALTQTASAEEREELRSLLMENPARWKKRLEFAMTLQVVAESLQKARTSEHTSARVPEHVRKRLLANLRKGRGTAGT